MMFIRVQFLLFVYFSITKADTFNSDEAKYIDLLPEQEKRDFLDRIARRIIAEIRTRHGNDKTSIEVSDESLNENSAYVQKIMDEETENMKMQRRQEDDLRNSNDADTNPIDINVRPLDNSDLKDENTLENVDLSATENKIRIKKGTLDHVSQIPVSLLYGNESNLPVTLKIYEKGNRQNDGNEELSKRNWRDEKPDIIQANGDNDLLRVIHDIGDKKSNDQNIEDNSERKSNSIVKARRKDLDLNDDKVTIGSKSEPIINDYDPQQEYSAKYNNSTLINKNHEKLVIDHTLARSIETENVENSTESHLKASKAINLKENIEGERKSAEDMLSDDSWHIDHNKHSTQTLLKGDDFGKTKKPYIVVTSNNSIELDVNMTESYTNTATAYKDLSSYLPKMDLKTQFHAKDNINTVTELSFDSKEGDKDDSWDKHVIKELKSNEGNTSHVLNILRSGQSDVSTGYKKKFQLKNSAKKVLPSDNSDHMNTYQVYEVSHNKPLFVASEQAHVSHPEEPYYVPMYNFASENAFYNAYNRFGPNNVRDYDQIDTRGFQPSNEEMSFDANSFKTTPSNVPRYFNKYSMKANNLGQRKFKHYRNNNLFKKQSINYQNLVNFIPLNHDKFFSINFNPSDYLDMDYYLGRSNGSPELLDDSVENKYETRTSPDHVHLQGMGSAPSARFDNIKSILSYVRKKLERQNMQKQNVKAGNKNLIKKLKITDEPLSNPILKNRNKSLLIILPNSRSKLDDGSYPEKRNIAVDYYFGRMSSVESFADYKGRETSATNHSAKLKADDLTRQNYDYVIDTDTESENNNFLKEKNQIPHKYGNVVKKDLTAKHKNVNLKLEKVKNTRQSTTSVILEAYLNVLKDMVEYNDERMIHYDWLGSAVDVQSALEKLLSLANIVHVTYDVHRSDVELLKYVLSLFESLVNNLAEDDYTRTRIGAKQKIRKGYGRRKMLVPIINRNQFEAWREVKNYMRGLQNLNFDGFHQNDLLNRFQDILLDLQENLNEMHEAIKQIATVTKYDRQRWFYDLKEVYLSPMDRRVTLNLLLHLSSTRLFGLIEESAKNGLEDNFSAYVQSHSAEVERTRDEFLFVLRLLKEINRLKS